MTSVLRLFRFANIEDESTGEAFEEFRYRKVGGRRGSIVVPREIADEPKQVLALLKKFNADLPCDPKQALAEVERVLQTEPDHLILCSARCGWREDDTAFVTSCETIDLRQRRPQLIRPPRRITGAQLRGMEPEGNLEDWIAEVADPCRYSDLGMTVIAAGFAAPLAKMSGRHSFGVNIYGRAKVGKSAMLLAGSSVGSAGHEEDLVNWEVSEPALGEQCRHHCDRLLAINESSLLKAEEAYTRMRKTAYFVAGDREREVHSKSAYATTDDSGRHRTIYVSSSEHSIAEYARLVGKTQDEGERARCTDVPVLRNGRSTIMDRFPASVLPAQRRAWAKQTVTSIRTGCKHSHGVALPPFIRFLMTDMEGAEQRTKAYMRRFMMEMDTDRMSLAIEHAAENFSLILAGGCMAIDARILNWKKGDLLRAVKRCFESAVGSAVEEADPLLRAKQLLHGRLTGDRIFRVKPSSPSFDAGRFDGFVAKEGERWKCVVRAASLREWLKTEAGAHQGIIRWLEQVRCLLPREVRSTQAGGRPSDWAERNINWPSGSNGTVTRSVVFYYPFAR